MELALFVRFADSRSFSLACSSNCTLRCMVRSILAPFLASAEPVQARLCARLIEKVHILRHPFSFGGFWRCCGVIQRFLPVRQCSRVVLRLSF